MEWLNHTQNILIALGFGHISLVSLVLILFCPISFVYALGRGLNILQTKIQKNTCAISLVVVLAILSVLGLIPAILQSILFLISLGFFVYVVLWQRFYSRADKRLDKMIGEDEEENDNGFVVKKKRKKS